jgi:hypothetical protein
LAQREALELEKRITEESEKRRTAKIARAKQLLKNADLDITDESIHNAIRHPEWYS